MKHFELQEKAREQGKVSFWAWRRARREGKDLATAEREEREHLREYQAELREYAKYVRGEG